MDAGTAFVMAAAVVLSVQNVNGQGVTAFALSAAIAAGAFGAVNGCAGMPARS